MPRQGPANDSPPCGPHSYRFGRVSGYILDVLHWLPYPQHIVYPISALVRRCIKGLAPSYLRELCCSTVTIQRRISLRSSDPLFLTKNLKFRQKYSSLTPFLSQFVLFLTSHNSTSQNIGGTDAWAVPLLKILGDVPSSPPRSLPMGKAACCCNNRRRCVIILSK